MMSMGSGTDVSVMQRNGSVRCHRKSQEKNRSQRLVTNVPIDRMPPLGNQLSP